MKKINFLKKKKKKKNTPAAEAAIVGKIQVAEAPENRYD